MSNYPTPLFETDSQHDSKTEACVASQRHLLLSRPSDESMFVPIEMVRSKKTHGQAFTLACDASCLEDKEIYIPLGIDPGTFSKIKSGKATFPAAQVREFCDLVNNTIYPEWIAYQVGCTLTLVLSEAERQLQAERERGDALQAKLAVVMELLEAKRL